MTKLAAPIAAGAIFAAAMSSQAEAAKLTCTHHGEVAKKLLRQKHPNFSNITLQTIEARIADCKKTSTWTYLTKSGSEAALPE